MGDRADWMRCMDVYGPLLARCIGDRIVADGYICPHCDSDSPQHKCAKPKRDAGTFMRGGERGC